ncbi:mucin-5AC-like [Pomacea canaliculata]|uniref:mucin-5AC-like n=1 Tax=Pomacea canaliculata TaxID=400727 RepID=UPI000D732660|nr:mucin-5AC-like [Pomacea canaliculata]
MGAEEINTLDTEAISKTLAPRSQQGVHVTAVHIPCCLVLKCMYYCLRNDTSQWSKTHLSGLDSSKPKAETIIWPKQEFYVLKTLEDLRYAQDGFHGTQKQYNPFNKFGNEDKTDTSSQSTTLLTLHAVVMVEVTTATSQDKVSIYQQSSPSTDSASSTGSPAKLLSSSIWSGVTNDSEFNDQTEKKTNYSTGEFDGTEHVTQDGFPSLASAVTLEQSVLTSLQGSFTGDNSTTDMTEQQERTTLDKDEQVSTDPPTDDDTTDTKVEVEYNTTESKPWTKDRNVEAAPSGGDTPVTGHVTHTASGTDPTSTHRTLLADGYSTDATDAGENTTEEAKVVESEARKPTSLINLTATTVVMDASSTHAASMTESSVVETTVSNVAGKTSAMATDFTSETTARHLVTTGELLLTENNSAHTAMTRDNTVTTTPATDDTLTERTLVTDDHMTVTTQVTGSSVTEPILVTEDFITETARLTNNSVTEMALVTDYINMDTTLTTDYPVTEAIVTTDDTISETALVSDDPLTETTLATEDITTETGLHYNLTNTLPVTRDNITDGTPGTHNITDGTPGTHNITDGTPGTHNITDGTPGTHNITDGTPGTHNITDGTPGTHSITDGTPGTHSITDGTPETHSITDGTPGTHSITDGSPGTHSITDGSPGTHSITDGTPGTHNITDGTPGTHNITDGTPGTHNITDARSVTDYRVTNTSLSTHYNITYSTSTTHDSVTDHTIVHTQPLSNESFTHYSVKGSSVTVPTTTTDTKQTTGVASHRISDTTLPRDHVYEDTSITDYVTDTSITNIFVDDTAAMTKDGSAHAGEVGDYSTTEMTSLMTTLVWRLSKTKLQNTMTDISDADAGTTPLSANVSSSITISTSEFVGSEAMTTGSSGLLTGPDSSLEMTTVRVSPQYISESLPTSVELPLHHTSPTQRTATTTGLEPDSYSTLELKGSTPGFENTDDFTAAQETPRTSSEAVATSDTTLQGISEELTSTSAMRPATTTTLHVEVKDTSTDGLRTVETLNSTLEATDEPTTFVDASRMMMTSHSTRVTSGVTSGVTSDTADLPNSSSSATSDEATSTSQTKKSSFSTSEATSEPMTWTDSSGPQWVTNGVTMLEKNTETTMSAPEISSTTEPELAATSKTIIDVSLSSRSSPEVTADVGTASDVTRDSSTLATQTSEVLTLVTTLGASFGNTETSHSGNFSESVDVTKSVKDGISTTALSESSYQTDFRDVSETVDTGSTTEKARDVILTDSPSLLTTSKETLETKTILTSQEATGGLAASTETTLNGTEFFQTSLDLTLEPPADQTFTTLSSTSEYEPDFTSSEPSLRPLKTSESTSRSFTFEATPVSEAVTSEETRGVSETRKTESFWSISSQELVSGYGTTQGSLSDVLSPETISEGVSLHGMTASSLAMSSQKTVSEPTKEPEMNSGSSSEIFTSASQSTIFWIVTSPVPSSEGISNETASDRGQPSASAALVSTESSIPETSSRPVNIISTSDLGVTARETTLELTSGRIGDTSHVSLGHSGRSDSVIEALTTDAVDIASETSFDFTSRPSTSSETVSSPVTTSMLTDVTGNQRVSKPTSGSSTITESYEVTTQSLRESTATSEATSTSLTSTSDSAITGSTTNMTREGIVSDSTQGSATDRVSTPGWTSEETESTSDSKHLTSESVTGETSIENTSEIVSRVTKPWLTTTGGTHEVAMSDSSVQTVNTSSLPAVKETTPVTEEPMVTSQGTTITVTSTIPTTSKIAVNGTSVFENSSGDIPTTASETVTSEAAVVVSTSSSELGLTTRDTKQEVAESSTTSATLPGQTLQTNGFISLETTSETLTSEMTVEPTRRESTLDITLATEAQVQNCIPPGTLIYLQKFYHSLCQPQSKQMTSRR